MPEIQNKNAGDDPKPDGPKVPTDKGLQAAASTPTWLTLTGAAAGFLMILIGYGIYQLAPEERMVWRLGFCTGIALIMAAFGTRADAQWRGAVVTGAGAVALVMFWALAQFGPEETPVKSARVAFYADYPDYVEMVGLESAGTPLPGAWERVNTKYFFRVLESDFVANPCLTFVVTADFDDSGEIEDNEEYSAELHRRHLNEVLIADTPASFWFDQDSQAVYKNEPEFIAGKPPIGSRTCIEPTVSMVEAPRRFAGLSDLLGVIATSFASDSPSDMVKNLTSRSSSVRREARAVLAKAGLKAVPVLVDAYNKQPDVYRIKLGVVNALNQMLNFKTASAAELNDAIPSETFRSLAMLIDDPDKTMRRSALSLVTATNNPDLVPTLLTILKDPQSEWGEFNAATALADLWPSLDDAAKTMVVDNVKPIAGTLSEESVGVVSQIVAERGSLKSDPTGWAFVGFFDGKSWNANSHFFDGDTLPSTGDTLTATAKSNIHTGAIAYDRKLGWVTQPTIGVIERGQKITVLEVQNISEGFIWVRFSAAGDGTASDSQAYYVVVGSFSSEQNAKSLAGRLKAKGYDPEVFQSTTGFYPVTIGQADRTAAEALRDKAVESGDAPKDSWLHDGSRFAKQVE